MPDNDVTIRSCHTIEEFEQMVDLELKVWNVGDRDLVPSQMYVVASKIGGQVLGAFVEGRMAGFVLAFPGIRDGKPYLHSHMAAVLPEFRDLGIGRRLKLAQRDEALGRGISLLEWTFDPLQAKNAYFNICRLGAIARRYLTNVYGSTISPLQAGLPTDRLVAEWHLSSQRVLDILAGCEPKYGSEAERVEIVGVDAASSQGAKIQSQARGQFERIFEGGYTVTWFERTSRGGTYILEK